MFGCSLCLLALCFLWRFGSKCADPFIKASKEGTHAVTLLQFHVVLLAQLSERWIHVDVVRC